MDKDNIIEKLIRRTKVEKQDGMILERGCNEEELYEQRQELMKLDLESLYSKKLQYNEIESCENELFNLGYVYLMLDKDYKILYVGSSEDIRTRILQSNRQKGEYDCNNITSNIKYT